MLLINCRFHNRAESGTPEISLRPAKSWAQEYHSTPNEDHSAGNKTHFDVSLGAPSTSRYSENSYVESSYSVYETPNESFADRSVPVSDSISNVDSAVLKSHSQPKLGKDSGIAKPQKEVNDEKQGRVGKTKSWASVASVTSTTKVKEPEVKESGGKANIVDWFEYNPEPEPKAPKTVIPKRETSKKSNKSKSNKSGPSLTEIAKDFVSHTDIKPDIKSSNHETDISKHKHSQNAKDLNQRLDSPKDSKLRYSPKHESVAEKLAKTSELERRHEKVSGEDQVVTGPLGDKHPYDEHLVNTTAEHTLPQTEKDNINDTKQSEAAAKGNSMVNETSEQTEKLDWWEESEQNKLTDTDEILVPAEEMIRVKQNDEFGFEDEFNDDDQWELQSDSDSDPGQGIIASQKPNNYDKDFPSTDLHKPVKPRADYGASSEVVNTDYDKDYPDIDLASYIEPPEPKATLEPAARWVPGERRCTLCGDKEHTTNECPDSASKLFF